MGDASGEVLSEGRKRPQRPSLSVSLSVSVSQHSHAGLMHILGSDFGG